MTERLARHAALHPKRMVAIWLGIFVLSIAAIVLLLPSSITTDAAVTNDPESEQGYDAIFRHLPPSDDFVNEVVLARSPGTDLTTDPQAQLEIERLAAALEATGRTAQVRSYFDDEDPSLLSPDKDAAVITIGMGPDAEDGIKDVIDVVEQADRGPLEVTITGEFTADDDFLTLSNKDLKEGELFFGLPAALIVLLFVFGAVVAGLVPVLLAIVAIVVALALVAVVGQVWEVSFFVVNMLTGMGLALGVDYALFIVSRFREERARDVEKVEAITATGRTANRAVLFSGTAFVIAMTGMLLVPDTILRSLAAGAILVGLTAVIAATTLLPAILSLLGDRVDALRLPFVGRGSGEGRFWGGIVARVQRRPLAYLLVSTAFLVLLTLPALDLRTGSAGVRTIPDGYASKDGFNALERELGVGTVDSAQIVVEGDVAAPPVRQGIEQLRAELASDQAFRNPELETAPDAQPRRGRGARRRGQPRREVGAGHRAAAFGGGAAGARPGRREGVRHRRDGGDSRLPRADGAVAADRVRVRARLQLHPAHARVPLDRRAGEGDRAQPALGRGRLRADRARLPEGRRQRALRLPAGGRDRGLAAALPLLRPLRALDGLPRLPAQQDP